MLIYRCDICGYETRRPQIVTNEFAYQGDGFCTIVRQFRPSPEVADLCKPCFKRWQQAQSDEAEKEQRKRDGILSRAWTALTVARGDK